MVALAHRHSDIAVDVVVNDTRNRARGFCVTRFFFKGVVATSYKSDFASYVKTRVTRLSAGAGDCNVFVLSRSAFGYAEFFEEVVFFTRDRIGLFEEDDVRAVADHIFALRSADRRNGEACFVR